MNIIEQIAVIIKLPFWAIFKTIFTLMNLVPLRVYEVHGHPGHGTENLARRSIHTKVKGDRKIHLGTWLISYFREKVFKAHLNTSGVWVWGVYSEDYLEIQNKWIW